MEKPKVLCTVDSNAAFCMQKPLEHLHQQPMQQHSLPASAYPHAGRAMVDSASQPSSAACLNTPHCYSQQSDGPLALEINGQTPSQHMPDPAMPAAGTAGATGPYRSNGTELSNSQPGACDDEFSAPPDYGAHGNAGHSMWSSHRHTSSPQPSSISMLVGGPSRPEACTNVGIRQNQHSQHGPCNSEDGPLGCRLISMSVLQPHYLNVPDAAFAWTAEKQESGVQHLSQGFAAADTPALPDSSNQSSVINSRSKPAQHPSMGFGQLALPSSVCFDPALQQLQCQAGDGRTVRGSHSPRSSPGIENAPQWDLHLAQLQTDPKAQKGVHRVPARLHEAGRMPTQQFASQPQSGGSSNLDPKPFKAPMLCRRHMQTPSVSQPDVAKSLWFPLTAPLQRTVIIPDGFECAKQYHMSFVRALREEINMRCAHWPSMNTGAHF